MAGARKDGRLTAKQEKFIRMSARGATRPEILEEVFGLDVKASPKNEIAVADVTMSRWRRLPQYPTIWREEVDKVLMGCTGKAIRTINGLMEAKDQPWLQLQAANSALSYGRQRVFGDEQNAVHVTIEGMPDLGSPDQDEQENV